MEVRVDTSGSTWSRSYGSGVLSGKPLTALIEHGQRLPYPRTIEIMSRKHLYDGLIRTTGEECDDGNLTDGDGCDHECRRERASEADSAPSS